MSQSMPFGEVLEAADQLTPAEQQALISILHHRLADAARKQIVADAAEAREEFANGDCNAATADDIMRCITQ